MERITLGKTGITVNRMGFGGIPIQRVSEEEAAATVLHAMEKGVDFIDTSRAYTTSERRIGMALKQTDKKPVIASKTQSRSAEDARKDLETSLSELDIDTIDLYQAHYVKDEADYQKVISKGGALEALISAKEEGLIRHIGITSHSLDLLDRIIDDNLFETIMVCYSFLEPAAEEKIIPKAIAANIGVIAMKSFSGGVIDNATLAVKYVIAQPGILIIPGVETQALFDLNWNVYQTSEPLTPEEKGKIDDIRKLYDKQFCRRCDYCQPCTENIPIQLILGMRFAAKRFGDGIFEKDWMKNGIEAARGCSECGECMERCPYDLPIPELIQKNLAWYEERG